MEYGRCSIKGIGLSEEEAATKPKLFLETTIAEISGNTAGKIFVGLQVEQPGAISLGLEVDGQKVEAVSNEPYAQTNLNPSKGRFESYALDLPMRLVGAEGQRFPAKHQIIIRWGMPNPGGVPTWVSSGKFSLIITGEMPKVKYDPKKDGD